MDADEYKKRVLTPFTRATRRNELLTARKELKDQPNLKVPTSLDLPFLYDISPPLTDAGCQTQVDAVRGVWSRLNERSRYGPLREVLSDLDKTLRAQNGSAFATAAFWQRLIDVQEQAAEAAIKGFVSVLKNEYRSFGVVTPDLLRDVAVDTGVDRLSDDRLAKAAKKAGLAVVEPFEVPDAVVSPALAKLAGTDCLSVVHAIYREQEPDTFTIVDAPGNPPITLAKVQATKALLQRRPESGSLGLIKKALTALAHDASTDDELHAIVLRSFVEQARAARANGLASSAVRSLTDSGMDPVDAGRIVLQAGGRSAVSGPQDVQEKLDASELRAARQRFDLLDGGGTSTDPELAAVGQRLAAIEARVAALSSQAEQAQRQGDVEGAGRALAEAVRLAADDDQLAAALRALPPAAPGRLTVAPLPDQSSVRVVWAAGYAATADVRYRVVRSTVGPPASGHDGEVLADGLDTTEILDEDAPVGVTTWYGVVAVRDQIPSSVTSTSVRHLPAVRELDAQTSPDTVTLTWRTPRGAIGVEVVEHAPVGTRRSIACTSADSALASDLTTGDAYRYEVSATYLDEQGKRHQSAVQSVVAVPATAARPLALLDVRPAAGNGQLQVQASWRDQGHPVEVWHFPAPVPWTFGARISRSMLDAERGDRLAGRLEPRGGRRLLVAAAPPGLRHYVAMTREGDQYLVGHLTALGLCPPVGRPRINRFVDELVVSWDWPEGDFDVAATWTADGTSRSQVITQHQYKEAGGLRIAAGPGPVTVHLRTMIDTPGEQWTSPEATVQAGGQTGVVSYRTEWPRRLRLTGPAPQVAFVFSSTQPVEADVVIVASPGRFLPTSTNGTTELLRTQVSLLEEPFVQRIEVPLGRFGREYWVRAFSTEPGEVRVVDPESASLKGR